MNIDDLQTAILSKDADGVVAALANWSEHDRAAAIEPYNLLMTALGFDDEAIKPCSFQPEDAVVKEKRKQLGIQRMSRQERNIDYDMVYVAWLAQYGIADLTAYGRFPCAPNNELLSAQIMADRRPPWFREWYASLTNSEEPDLSPLFWSYLYQHDLVGADDFPSVALRFSAELPAAFTTDADAVQKVLREIPACCELIYQVPHSRLSVVLWQRLDTGHPVDESRELAGSIAVSACRSGRASRSPQSDRTQWLCADGQSGDGRRRYVGQVTTTLDWIAR